MPHRRSQPGFTLIELLVVVAVIGVVVSVGLLSLGVLGDDRLLRREAVRFASLLEVAQDEAVLQGREFGIEIMRDSYRFLEYDGYRLAWAEISADDVFRTRRLPADAEFDLFLENKRVSLEANAAELRSPDKDENPDRRERRERRDRRNEYSPHILIYSSGESTPFELRLVDRELDQAVILTGDLAGEIEVMNEQETADAML